MRNALLGLVAGLILGVGLSMLQRDLDDSPPPSPPRSGAQPNGVQPSPPPDPGKEDAGPADPAEPDEPQEPSVPVPEDSVLDLLRRTLVNKGGMGKIADWERGLPLLEARRDEVIPILEDWIRRWKEISRTGAGIVTAYLAYAELAGADAIPLLEEHLYDDPGRWGACRDALIRIDDPRAANALHRFQESMRPDVKGVTPSMLWFGSESSRQLVREWADRPPPTQPHLGWKARRVLFKFGTEPEKDRVWREADAQPRRALLCSQMFKRWPEPWPERYRATVLDALASENVGIRLFALGRIAEAADFFGEKAVRRAEDTLARDLKALGPEAEENDMPKMALTSLKYKFASRRRELDRQRQVREILRPR